MNVQMFLKDHGVPFEPLVHAPAYDAQRMAQVLHVPGREVAKTVLLRTESGGEYFVAVLPATRHVDLKKAAVVLGSSPLELASEFELSQHVRDCELGTLPPFGSQYGMQTVLERSLTDDETVVFEGNSHHESIRMKLADYCQLERPLVASFAYEAAEVG